MFSVVCFLFCLNPTVGGFQVEILKSDSELLLRTPPTYTQHVTGKRVQQCTFMRVISFETTSKLYIRNGLHNFTKSDQILVEHQIE